MATMATSWQLACEQPAQLPIRRELLPSEEWQQLEDFGIADYMEVKALWARTVAYLAPDGGDPRLAALFEYSMVGLLDAQLLARVLRERVDTAEACKQYAVEKGVHEFP